MPNHVTNRITFDGDDEQVEKMLEAVQYDSIGIGSLDFNKVIPMPESLNIEAGSRTEKGLELYSDFLKSSQRVAEVGLVSSPEAHETAVNEHLAKFDELRKDDPELWALGETAFNNLQDYGHATWYDWAIDKWGTKWNSYGYDGQADYEAGSKSITFQTAWAAPHPILERLSEMYPEIIINHRWADEDFGYNCGEREYENGEMSLQNTPAGGSKEAYELAADIADCDLAELGYRLSEDDSAYEYHDPDEGEAEEMGEMKL